jgi:hypothetical protein
MPAPYRYIAVQRQQDVFCVHLREKELLESQVNELGRELANLVTEDGCRKMVLSLGPEAPYLLYSVFLARLVTVRRLLLDGGGTTLKLSEVTPLVKNVFAACQLAPLFEFYADTATAVASFAK